MANAQLNFQNILVIDLGQLGDVVLSLPALRAIRRKFPYGNITVLAGKIPSEVIDLSGSADEIIPVDKVQLRQSSKIWSIWQILRLVKDVRSRKFDLIIDLHSLYETNLLAFFSGTKYRLLANRESRSLDFLGNFDSRPPLEDKAMHIVDRYFDVLKPLAVDASEKKIILSPSSVDLDYVDREYFGSLVPGSLKMVGLFPGAGNPSRCWSLTKFAELAAKLSKNGLRPVVFLGPEEALLKDRVIEGFPAETIVCDKLTISQLIAALSRIPVFVANDTGPLHLALAVGTPTVVLLYETAPKTFMPESGTLFLIQNKQIDDIQVDEVYGAVLSALKLSVVDEKLMLEKAV
ncbi:MAG: glycosyltransferase family 9 protein [Saprospiraceae bacterium]|nr:glycosyltransferase family 9 protein [Pyrinomonadaceae bacterium]